MTATRGGRLSVRVFTISWVDPSRMFLIQGSSSRFRVELSEVVSAKDKTELSNHFLDRDVGGTRLHVEKAIRLIEPNTYLIAVVPLHVLNLFLVEIREEAHRIEVDGRLLHRSEERRVGKECRSRWSP